MAGEVAVEQTIDSCILTSISISAPQTVER
jgi:hypothetical protein